MLQTLGLGMRNEALNYLMCESILKLVTVGGYAEVVFILHVSWVLKAESPKFLVAKTLNFYWVIFPLKMAEKGFSKSTVAKCNDRVRLSPTEDEVAKLFTGRGRGARGEASPCFYPLFLAETDVRKHHLISSICGRIYYIYYMFYSTMFLTFVSSATDARKISYIQSILIWGHVS